MRFISLIVVITAVVAGVQAGITPDAAAECGDLGVFKFAPSSLPTGVDPTAVRHCKEHPLHNATAAGPVSESASPGLTTSLHKRQCYYADAYGCTNGYCWKQCNTPGSGQWCWQAWNQGWGAWRSCAGRGDCNLISTADCGQGGCKDCGCSC